MESVAAQTPQPGAGLRRMAGAAALIALAGYALLLARNVGAVAGGSDSSGYVNQARLLGEGRIRASARVVPGLPPAEAPPFLYKPLGFIPAPAGAELIPTYPVGLSLLILAGRPLAGWDHAGDLVIIAHALAALGATYALARALGLGSGPAALAASMLAACPVFLWQSLQAMSDVPSTAWTTAAVLAALGSRERPGWAFAAGAAMSVDVLLRPTNVLAFIPVAAALGPSPRRWALLLAGGLPGALFFALHNSAAFGSWLATGYGDNRVDFAVSFAPITLAHYVRWLPLLLSPAVVLVLGLPWARQEPRTRWLLGGWIVGYSAFYAFYRFTHEAWWSLRFLLPAAPAMVVGALLVLRGALSRAPRVAAAVLSPLGFAVALAFVVANSAWLGRDLQTLSIGTGERKYAQVAAWMNTHLPKDAVCVAMQESGALFYYTDFILVRWDAIGPSDVGRVESAIRRSGRPMYAVLFPFEVTECGVLDRRLPGRWSQVGAVDDVTIWRRDLGAP